MLYAGQYDLKPNRQPPQRHLGAARSMKSPRGWQRPFDDPIPLPRGRYLVTLEEAGNYITRLPKAKHKAAEWQAAMEALILVASSGGPTMFAQIGVMRALNRHVQCDVTLANQKIIRTKHLPHRAGSGGRWPLR